MNKKIFIFLIIVLISSSVFYYYNSNQQNTSVGNPGSKLPDDDNFTGSDYKGNYVWGGAMNLAWNELSENILREKIQFVSQDKTVQDFAKRFNSRFFTTNDLDAESYYVKSGFGQETVSLINKESRAKFPSKSLSDLKVILNPEDVIAYAYFLKQVEYSVQFNEESMEFEGTTVDAFHAKNDKQNENIKIIKYWDEDKFIISLQLKDKNDQLIVAKGFDMSTPQTISAEINKYAAEEFETMNKNDVFEMPKLHLDMSRIYTELENQHLVNKIRGKDTKIKSMFENIKFDIDHKGARVENEAVIVLAPVSANPNRPNNYKKLVLDKPFWVIMKRANSEAPYFTLGVNNTELMTVK